MAHLYIQTVDCVDGSEGEQAQPYSLPPSLPPSLDLHRSSIFNFSEKNRAKRHCMAFASHSVDALTQEVQGNIRLQTSRTRQDKTRQDKSARNTGTLRALLVNISIMGPKLRYPNFALNGKG
jgi:hypothetical protein